MSFRYWLVVLALWPGISVFGQSLSLPQLEDSVYVLNNALKYNQSQALLLPVLEKGNVDADYKYHTALLLSYTYKRLGDYESTLQFLATARQFARQTPTPAPYLAYVLSQEAFAQFDVRAYAQSDSLMRLLEATDFRHIDLENKAKLTMQRGFLLFLNKQYGRAEATYDQAIGWLQQSSPCDLPMILVKKMQLYAAMNRMDRVQAALQLSARAADSCGIIKYRIYALDELKEIYKARHDLPGIANATQALDSLNLVYNRDVKLAALHNQKETIRLEGKNSQLHVLLALLAGLGLVALGLAGGLVVYRRQQGKLEADQIRMKAELAQYLQQNQIAPAHQPALSSPLTSLSDRQREVLDCMAVGMSNKVIADKLFISENTVKYHIKNIYTLLQVKGRQDLIAHKTNGSA
jgi:DNA-binding CsgD family transcriptional regulator